jgi:hypothetical protein
VAPIHLRRIPEECYPQPGKGDGGNPVRHVFCVLRAGGVGLGRWWAGRVSGDCRLDIWAARELPFLTGSQKNALTGGAALFGGR